MNSGGIRNCIEIRPKIDGDPNLQISQLKASTMSTELRNWLTLSPNAICSDWRNSVPHSHQPSPFAHWIQTSLGYPSTLQLHQDWEGPHDLVPAQIQVPLLESWVKLLVYTYCTPWLTPPVWQKSGCSLKNLVSRSMYQNLPTHIGVNHCVNIYVNIAWSERVYGKANKLKFLSKQKIWRYREKMI